MKKSFLTLALIGLSFSAFSQKIEIQNASNYSRNRDIVKAVESIEKATTNEETKNDCKAWYLKGYILVQLDDMYSIAKLAEPGLSEKEYNKAIAPYNPTAPGSPLTPEATKNIKNPDKSKTRRATYIYDVNVFFQDDKLQYATEPTEGKYAETYKPSILDCAVEAFDKCITLGTEKEYVELAKANLQMLIDRFYNLAVNNYNEKKYLDASMYFEKTNDLSAKYFNAPNEENITYARECYRYEVNELLNQSDTTAALNVISQGLQKYPDYVELMLAEAQIYLVRGENQKVIDRLEKVVEFEKDNVTLFYIIGQSYANLGNEEKALETYEKALTIDPNHFETNYNVASLYFNRGKDLSDKANALPFDAPVEEYDGLVAQSTEWFEKSVPYLEKSAEMAKDDIVILNALKSVYTRLQRTEDALKINNQIKELQAAEPAAAPAQ